MGASAARLHRIAILRPVVLLHLQRYIASSLHVDNLQDPEPRRTLDMKARLARRPTLATRAIALGRR